MAAFGACRGKALPALRGAADTPLAPVLSSAEQSNTSIVYGGSLTLKLFRRQQPGPQPEIEIGRYLTEAAHFDGVPPFAGSIEYERHGGECWTFGVLDGMVANEGDAWTLTLEELERYYEECAHAPLPVSAGGPDTGPARDCVGIALQSAARLGERTAALHLSLAAQFEDPAFSPEPLTSADLQTLLGDIRGQAAGAFDALRDSMARLPDETLEPAGLVLGRRKPIIENLGRILKDGSDAQRIRIHGDYHLGQVLRVRGDYVILDFEGEPARPLEERRAKQSPLKDVASMLRSLSYAAYASLINYTSRHSDDFDKLEPWARVWERATAGEFLRAYRETASGARFLPSGEEEFHKLLTAYWLDKVLYELSYELNNRPNWVRIPLLGILSFPVEAGGQGWNPAPSGSPR